jgi:hypothetical protein
MGKRCSICTDGIEASGMDRCPKCQDLTDLGVDRISILLRHAKRIPRRAERYLARAEHFREIDAKAAETSKAVVEVMPEPVAQKRCKICGTSPRLKDRNCCRECFGIKKTISDPYEICQHLIQKRPEKAAQYQAMADQHRQRMIDSSVDAEREIRTNRRLAALAASTKPCKPRITTTNGVESTCQYWRCGRCRQVLTRRNCLKCEMIIKGEIQDE